MTKVASSLGVPIELDHPLLILPLIAQKSSGRETRAIARLALMTLAACAGPQLPAANSALAVYDARDNAIHVTVSGLQPASEAVLIGQDGSQYPAVGFSVISGPHVLYNPPPSISLGIGGFGFTGCCSSIGSGYRSRAAGRTSNCRRGERSIFDLGTDHCTS
jgi:hypothetical protein